MPGTTGITASNPSTPRSEGKPLGFDTVTATTLAGTFCGFLVGAENGSVKSILVGSAIGSASGWVLGKTLEHFIIKPSPDSGVKPISEPTPFREQHISETPPAIHAPPAETTAPQNKLPEPEPEPEPEPPRASKTEASRAARHAKEQGTRLTLTITDWSKMEHMTRQAIRRDLNLAPVPESFTETGGHGSVSKWAGTRGKNYAVKTITNYDNPPKLNLCRGEVVGLLDINHPNILKVHHLVVFNILTDESLTISSPDDIPEYQRSSCIVTAVVSDWVEGCDITNLEDERYLKDPAIQAIRQHYPTGIETAITLGIKIADALDHLHSKGIIHRDINPKNIVIDHNKDPILVDFGTSKPLKKDQTTHSPIGCPDTAAPEVMSNCLYEFRDPYKHSADLFSLGSTLLYLATGWFPHELTEEGTVNLDYSYEGRRKIYNRTIKFSKMTEEEKTQKLKKCTAFANDNRGLLAVIINLLDANPENRMSASTTCAVLRDLQQRGLQKTGQTTGT